MKADAKYAKAREAYRENPSDKTRRALSKAKEAIILQSKAKTSGGTKAKKKK